MIYIAHLKQFAHFIFKTYLVQAINKSGEKRNIFQYLFRLQQIKNKNFSYIFYTLYMWCVVY